MEVVQNVEDKVKEVIDDSKEAKEVIEQTAVTIQHTTVQMASSGDEVKRNQLREKLHKWLSLSD